MLVNNRGVSMFGVGNKDIFKVPDPVVNTAIELSQIAAIGSQTILNKNTTTVPPIKQHVEVLKETTKSLSKVLSTAEKISDFVMEYGLHTFLATGAILFGIAQLATLNIPMGTIAISLGLAELANIAFNYSRNSNLDLAFDTIQNDVDEIKRIGARNSKVIGDIQSKTKESILIIDRLKVSAGSIEGIATEISQELKKLEDEIKELQSEFDADKAEALKCFKKSQGFEKKAMKAFEEATLFSSDLLFIDRSETKEEIIKFVQETGTTIQGFHETGFRHYIKSQKQFDKGTSYLNSASICNEKIQGKITLLKEKAIAIADQARIEAENLLKIESKQNEIEELGFELNNNQDLIKETIKSMDDHISEAKKVAKSEVNKNVMISTAGAVAGHVMGYGVLGVIAGAYMLPKVVSGLIPDGQGREVVTKPEKLNASQQVMLLGLLQKYKSDPKKQENENFYREAYQVIIGGNSVTTATTFEEDNLSLL